jgi:hypothetical protein
MPKIRDNGGVVGKMNTANTTYQSGIWNISEHNFYAIGSPTFWQDSQRVLVDLLLVGGGGGGGAGGCAVPGGGGGAGGVFYKKGIAVKKNITYTVVVGDGAPRKIGSGTASNGANTTLNGNFYGYDNATIIARGGGGGGGWSGRTGQAGGSGGGGSGGFAAGGALQPTQIMIGPGIFIGGNFGNIGITGNSGGGGGAGAAATNEFGGAGTAVDITGYDGIYYGGGGGGSINAPGVPGTGGIGGGGAAGYFFNGCLPRRDGINGLGGGGGAGGGSGDVTGGAGGSGVVIISISNTFGTASFTGGATLTYTPMTNPMYTFLSNGTITFI